MLIVFLKFLNIFICLESAQTVQIDFVLFWKVYEQKTTKEYHSRCQQDVYDVFGCPLGDQDKTWAPHILFKKYLVGLHNWLNKWSSICCCLNDLA